MTDSTPWVPQDGPQRFAIEHAYVEEMFYGGAVGGGKSDFLLGDFAQDIPTEWGPYWHGILFRKTYPQLEELIKRSLEIYPQWFPGCHYNANDKTWYWPNGATLKLRHMQNDKDWMNYWGHQYTWIGFDELPTWSTDEQYNKLKSRLRSAHPVPYKRIRSTGNPGGPGHQWIKSMFHIDTNPQGGVIFEEPIDDEMKAILVSVGVDPATQSPPRKMFVLSKLTDNKIMLNADPTYMSRLLQLGSAALVKAWLQGDWSVVAGAFFNEFNPDRHLIKPYTIPKHFTRFRAMDWGSAKPFCVLWFAVSDGTDVETNKLGIPRGALIVYREYYGMVEGKPNVGLKLHDSEVARNIKRMEAMDPKIDFAVCDPSMYAEKGGPSNAQNYAKEGVHFSPADNSRLAGWAQVRARLKGEGTGQHDRPMIFFFDTCINTIRTLPAVQHDQNKAEDIDTNDEDHAMDALRYGCMARMWIEDAPKSALPVLPRPLSGMELIQRQRKKRLKGN